MRSTLTTGPNFRDHLFLKISCFPLPKTPFKTYPVVEGFCPTLPQKYQPKLWLCIPSAARRPNRKKIAAKSLSVNLGLVDHI